ncbi:MIP/aquaporin family protein [Spiroplasma taiwanense]|uniref:Glycerol uptake facilitator protein n=1 Tax=Spiroplasma taiwanense CT-1 TaxID=1276220 RepID=S5MC98_9MOLU|nr:MIP/aquaporin family protein [Spiroplasma taiwanense]AGR41358.1 glycerol uptake facilitator protein [Spiroplasma taiwanense CT-1]
MNLTELFLTEFFGTSLLIILGNGIVANCVLKDTKGNNAGLVAIALGWGFAVTVSALIASSFNGAPGWFNPAVMVGATIADKGDLMIQLTGSTSGAIGLFFGLFFVQLLGAMLGQIIIDLLYFKHIQKTLQTKEEFSTANVLGMHSTSSTFKGSLFSFTTLLNLLMEFVGTFVLVFAALAMGKFASGTFFGPIVIGIVVISIGLSLGGTTGYAINPVRDLGPRIIHMLMPLKEKGKSDWSYSFVPVLAAILAGVSVGAIFLLF